MNVLFEYWNKCFESATSKNIDVHVYGAKRLDKYVSRENKIKSLKFITFYLRLFVEYKHYLLKL